MSAAAVGWTLYLVAVVALIAALWKRIGDLDRAHDELERLRDRHR